MSTAEPLLSQSLYAAFPGSEDRPQVKSIRAEAIPEPYHRLLVHPHHMTVTVEEFYGDAVDVEVLDVRTHSHEYCRKILLRLKQSRRVVQFGIVRIHLDQLSDEVRAEIESRRTPLGRILIQHDVLRHIQSKGFLEATPSAQLQEWFGMKEPDTLYGRLGVIYTDNHPTIEVLEILAPVPERNS